VEISTESIYTLKTKAKTNWANAKIIKKMRKLKVYFLKGA